MEDLKTRNLDYLHGRLIQSGSGNQCMSHSVTALTSMRCQPAWNLAFGRAVHG